MQRRQLGGVNLAIALTIATAACGGGQARVAPLAPAGADIDDGTGQLARSSVKLRPLAGVEAGAFRSQDVVSSSDRYGGFVYGGSAYGGFSYGGGSQIDASAIERPLPYTVTSIADAGAIVGKVTWARPPAAPATLVTACGELANPTLPVGPGGAVRGAIVYLAALDKGKPMPTMSGPTHHGGVVYREGCALWPQAQVIGPVPARLRVSSPEAVDLTVARAYQADGERRVDTQALAIKALGEVTLAAGTGVTTIASPDGSLLPATLVAVPHPYITRTAADGSFRLEDVVPGTYQVTVWVAPIATGMKGTAFVLSAPVEVTRSVTVPASGQARLDVALP